MKITVFGATGRVGSSVVKQALAAGHEVSAYTRAASAQNVPPGARVHIGALDDVQAISTCIAGADAVISALGPRKNAADQVPLLAGAYRHICAAMADAQVKRLVAISGSGTHLPGEPISFGRRTLRSVMMLLDRHILRANEAAALQIIGTDLDWVLVRPPRIKTGEAVGNCVADSYATPSMQITVGDVAAFLLASVQSDDWVRQAPFVAAG